MAPRPHRAARLLLAALLTLAVACGGGEGEDEDEAEDGGAEVEQDD